MNHHSYTVAQNDPMEEVFQLLSSSFGTEITLKYKRKKHYLRNCLQQTSKIFVSHCLQLLYLFILLCFYKPSKNIRGCEALTLTTKKLAAVTTLE